MLLETVASFLETRAHILLIGKLFLSLRVQLPALHLRFGHRLESLVAPFAISAGASRAHFRRVQTFAAVAVRADFGGVGGHSSVAVGAAIPRRIVCDDVHSCSSGDSKCPLA